MDQKKTFQFLVLYKKLKCLKIVTESIIFLNKNYIVYSENESFVPAYCLRYFAMKRAALP